MISRTLRMGLGILLTLLAAVSSLCQTSINRNHNSSDTVGSSRNGNPSMKASCVGVSGTDSGKRYLDTVNGLDSNDGCSFGSAKASVRGACSAIPNGNSFCTAGIGTIIATPVSVAALPAGAVPTVTLIVQLPDGECTSGPIPWIDVRCFGARQLGTFNTITATTNRTSTITTNGISDFQKYDGIVIPAAGPATSQSTPSAPTLTVVGATGSSSVSYKCIGVDTEWGLTAASARATVSTVPPVFGLGAVAVSSAIWSSNTVTLTTSTNLPFSSGTYHIMVINLFSGTTNLSGMFNATITSATTLTYFFSGSGAVTVGTSSNVILVNGFDLTQVSETAGSDQIVLTTDVKHNFRQQLSTTQPTKIFLDGIDFAGESLPGYANGLFTITSTTSNTITITTPYTATLTENATASASYATSGAAQMTALVWPEVVVACPSNTDGTPSNGGAYYAVYANYGSGYAPIGFTPWQHSVLIDYGPAFTKAGFTPPPAMDLPSTPPSAAQAQVFEAQIIGINGITLTLDRSTTLSVSNVTAYHSNGIALQNAVNMSCERNDGVPQNHFVPVYLPPANGSGNYYLFNAPIDISAGSNACNRINILEGAPVYLNGTIMAAKAGYVSWVRPQSLAGFDTEYSGAISSGVTAIGYASPMMASTTSATWKIQGMAFSSLSNGQNEVVLLAENSRLSEDSFKNNSGNLLSAIPVLLGGGFTDELKDLSWGTIPNISAPLPGGCGLCGQVMYWPVPTFELISGPNGPSNIRLEGTNYANGTGFEYTPIYQGGNTPAFFWEFNNVETFQEPWQPFFTIEGQAEVQSASFEKIQMDSIQMPPVSNLYPGNVGNAIFREAYNDSGTTPKLTGYSFSSVFEFAGAARENPAQNTNDCMTGPGGFQCSQQLYAKLLGQLSAANFAGSCSMSSATSCTRTVNAKFNDPPLCFATDTATSSIVAATCRDISGTVTVTAASSNSHTFNFLLIGNPN